MSAISAFVQRLILADLGLRYVSIMFPPLLK